jgi:hypothetical protein
LRLALGPCVTRVTAHVRGGLFTEHYNADGRQCQGAHLDDEALDLAISSETFLVPTSRALEVDLDPAHREVIPDWVYEIAVTEAAFHHASFVAAMNSGMRIGAGLVGLSSWPKGTRVIARKERPHSGAQSGFTDIDGHRLTCFATSTRKGPAGRPRAAASPPGLVRGPHQVRQGHRPRNLRHSYGQNQISCQIVSLACELIAQTLALIGSARSWELKRLRAATVLRRWADRPRAAPEVDDLAGGGEMRQILVAADAGACEVTAEAQL